MDSLDVGRVRVRSVSPDKVLSRGSTCVEMPSARKMIDIFKEIVGVPNNGFSYLRRGTHQRFDVYGVVGRVDGLDYGLSFVKCRNPIGKLFFPALIVSNGLLETYTPENRTVLGEDAERARYVFEAQHNRAGIYPVGAWPTDCQGSFFKGQDEVLFYFIKDERLEEITIGLVRRLEDSLGLPSERVG